MNTDSVNEGDLPSAWRVPDDLPQRIVANSEHMREFEARRYRRAVAIKALDLMGFVAAEQAKRTVNSERASGRREAAQ